MKSIPKIYRLGERFTNGIFDGPVVIEEKIDGSQFSFISEWSGDQKDAPVLKCFSKSTEINLNDPGMFRPAVETATRLWLAGLLEPGWHYHCEFLAKPKHNVLAYSRIPNNHLVLFDIKSANFYAPVALKHEIADKLGLEPVPVLFDGLLSDIGSDTVPKASEAIAHLLGFDSVLGGQKIEGVVIKNYAKQHLDTQQEGSHPMTAKVVSDAFKERISCRPQRVKVGPGEEVERIVQALRTEARWVKAVQHLREAGQLANTSKDIGPLMKELHTDLETEEQDWIKQELYDAFIKKIKHGVAQGFPQWYQQILSNGGLSVFDSQTKSS